MLNWPARQETGNSKQLPFTVGILKVAFEIIFVRLAGDLAQQVRVHNRQITMDGAPVSEGARPSFSQFKSPGLRALSSALLFGKTLL